MAFGTNTAQIKAVITAKDEASGTLNKFGKKLGSIGALAGKALLGIGVAAVAMGVVSVKAYADSENQLAQLNATLKSTKGAAGVTAQAAIDLSKAMQRVTTYSDEQVLSAENLMLTFTSVGKKVFPDATKAALDMSTALHEDLQSSVIRIGKALQDPILGLTALRKAGVNVNQAFKDHIKTLVEAGKKEEAQKFILQELNTEFGGSAEAARKTFGGALKGLWNNLNDGEETIGGFIANGLTPLINKFSDFVGKIDFKVAIDRSIQSIKSLYSSIHDYLAPGIERFIFVAKEAWNWLYGMLEPSFAALAKTLETKVWPQLKRIWEAIEPGFTTALKILGVALGVYLVSALWLFTNALNIAWRVIGFGIQIITNLIKWYGNAYGVIINFAKGIPHFFKVAWKDLEPIIEAPFKAAFKYIREGLKLIVDQFNRVKNDITGAPGHAVSGVSGLLHKLPGFAEGGTVPGPTGAPTLAVVHGGEQVIPVGGGGGGAINISINAGAYMGSQQDARRYAQMIITAMGDIASSKNKSVNQLLGIA